MELSWHQASKDLSPFVTGFVERRDLIRAGASIKLPLAVPLLHLTLGATYTFTLSSCASDKGQGENAAPAASM